MKLWHKIALGILIGVVLAFLVEGIWRFIDAADEKQACDDISVKALKVAENAAEGEMVWKEEAKYCAEQNEKLREEYSNIMGALEVCLQENERLKGDE